MINGPCIGGRAGGRVVAVVSGRWGLVCPHTHSSLHSRPCPLARDERYGAREAIELNSNSRSNSRSEFELGASVSAYPQFAALESVSSRRPAGGGCAMCVAGAISGRGRRRRRRRTAAASVKASLSPSPLPPRPPPPSLYFRRRRRTAAASVKASPSPCPSLPPPSLSISGGGGRRRPPQ